ncbi:unnamed protein product [Orchesella dallaii]|uniref:Gustatory receptor n=1 Tax=Orchesella dallaii TaxID=48710 RepID=A0ABP1R7P3_9HEXA
MLNCLIHIEKTQAEMTFVSSRDKWILNFPQFNGLVSAPILAFAYAAQRWVNPCQSTTVFLYLLEESCKNEKHVKGSNWNFKSYFYLIFIYFSSLWVCAYLIGAFALQCTEFFLVPFYCLVTYIKNFRAALEKGRKDNVERILLKYRQLQILERSLNWMHQDMVTPAVLNIFIMAAIISTYVIISEGTQLNILHLIMFSCVLIDSIASIVLGFGTFGLVHTESTITLDVLKEKLIPRLELEAVRSTQVKYLKLKLVKKFVASLYVLKVRIGNVNFVEKTTPITVLDFCLAQIVNLLLMK